MKKFLLVLITILFNVSFLLAQSYNIDAVDGTTITDCTITLYDSGGSGGDYQDGEDYEVTICSGSTDAIQIVFNSFNTESGWDYVYIYDGANTLSPQVGGSPFSGTTIPGTITSSGSCITIRFYADGSNVSDGFQLTTTCVTPPSGDNIDDVDGTTLTGCNYTIYDSGGPFGDYTNNETYTVTICSGSAQFLQVSFASFYTESSLDDLNIYDGIGTGGTLLGSFSGSTIPSDLITTSTCITIEFDSDGSVVYDGFELSVSCLCTPANVTVTQTCAGDNSSYDLEVDVTALVDASSVDIIIGGTIEESSVGVGTYTYNGLTSGTTVEVVDDSDPTCSYTESVIMCSNEYNIDVVDGSTLTGCSYTIYDSGGDSGDYLNNEYYTVTICSGTSDYIGVSFANFYTESIDDLNIYDGIGTGGTLLGSFSGSTIPSDLNTSSTCITIEFDSDGSVVYSGFELTTSCICNPANATITQNCAADNSYYDLSILISSMVEAATVNIVVGGTTEYSGVGVGTYPVNGLVAGTTVQIIDAVDPTCIYSETVLLCDICNNPTAPADECAGAPLIDLSQPFEGSTDCSYTASSGNPENCGSIENDSFISFIAGDTEVEMDYTVGDCSIDDGIQLSVFSGVCGSLVDLAGSCVNPTGENTTGTWNFTGLTIGEIYYIRIDGFGGDLCDYYFEPISGVVITPPNDECPDATPLNCGDIDIASNILATAVDAPAGCSSGGTPAEGVWYSFIGTGDEVTISTDNAGTNFDTEINVFVGPCTALTCVGGDDDSGTGTTSSYTFTTTTGVEYFIYVDGNGTSVGQFEISLVCTNAPPCDADAGVWD